MAISFTLTFFAWVSTAQVPSVLSPSLQPGLYHSAPVIPVSVQVTAGLLPFCFFHGPPLVFWSEYTNTPTDLLMFRSRNIVHTRDSLICLISLDMFSSFILINNKEMFSGVYLSFLKMHVCLCACMCVHAHVETRGQPWMPSPAVLFPLRSGSLTGL